MKKTILYTALAAAVIVTSCSQIRPGMVTTAKSLKTGEAKKKVWFGIGNVDVSAATAAKNGGITKIATVDYGVKHGLFATTYITLVSGE